ncbi:MAG: SPOR domain-containing protein [Alphaproteobacteria bacterium]|nr:SPOR domain-containing protein [Alphaproteobacteria bacterium]
MDQDSTNGASNDKRNWRERLGIGTRDMPKLSEEFKGQPATKGAAQPAARPAPRAPQPVVRPAPMAPRVPVAKPAPAPAGRQPPAQNGQVRPQQPPPSGGSDALAEKLRAQRAAAEKLAEQRVQAARERAEGRSPAAESPPSRPRIQEPPPPARHETARPESRPKFSFADDEGSRRGGPPPAEQQSYAQRTQAGPLLPPRPALGGDRGAPPFLRPSYRPEPAHGYRPIDPATGYAGVPPRQPPPLRPYGAEADPYYGGRHAPPAPRRPAPDPYAHGNEPEFETEAYPDEPPRLSRSTSARGRARMREEEPEDIFEDEGQQRRRASAHDYQSAYRESAEGYEDDRRRSSGPWLLLLALLVAALVTGGIVWYYNTKMKTATVPGQGDSVPVIAAPEQPAKTAPEKPADSAGQDPAVKKKQIYDRIIGEQEVLGNELQPTEEVPMQPEAAAPAADGTGAGQIPEPTGGLPDTLEEPAPLPLPPPPGDADTQGNLGQTGASDVAAVANDDPPAMPPPQEAPAGAANSKQASPPSSAEPADDLALELEKPAKPVKKIEPAKKPAKKAVETAKKTTTPDPVEDLGAEPVVLVAPSQDSGTVQDEVAASTPAVAPGQQQAPKKKTLFDLFKPSDQTTTQSTQPAQRKVAAVEPPAEPAPAPQQQSKPVSSGGPGYLVQLASFRTQSEAQSEYDRLRSRYPNVIGNLPSNISQATVAGSTRYRVGVGPLSTREQASKVCSSLFAAGERDCLIRSQ